METELLKTFDENGTEIGTATREDVHRQGLWHETFHCWFVSKEQDKNFIYFQLRSKVKKDYPNLLDITAAGHLLAHETTEDGVREVEEELGIHVSIQDLTFLGILKYEVMRGELIDRELAHTYLYEYKGSFDDFQLQIEEVTGMYRADFTSFIELITGEITELHIDGFELNEVGEKVNFEKKVTMNSFVPHEESFYQDVVSRIHEMIV
ncbi:NUDIX hydrolase [Bacillus suaedaesalsae]|uniref:NUDIX domain-containing protein n=1 Tax=Bacillus suaedaesalsae TaxID=2810349 RepID=A0ABS2DKC1_9BACI|nr:NUDIX domain-containing protein [Bacillus suaedaesalsae]MBM6618908.1 NUDIX domain-containing protein [Bacillus suaedaesalsae]